MEANAGMRKVPGIAQERLRQAATRERFALPPSLIYMERHGVNQPDHVTRSG